MRILITGAAGSGTSTLCSALAFALGGVQVEADDYFWIPTSPPFTTKRDPAARLSSVLCDLRAQEATLSVLKKSFVARAMRSKFSGSWPLKICGAA